MSLVTSTAFQQSLAVQASSFVALAVRQVDDDFLYQILVAFRAALAKASKRTRSSLLACSGVCVESCPPLRRHPDTFVPIFGSRSLGLYVEATWLLQVTLEYMEQHDILENYSVETVLLEACEQVDEVMSQLEDVLRVSFIRSFSYSLSSIICVIHSRKDQPSLS